MQPSTFRPRTTCSQTQPSQQWIYVKAVKIDGGPGLVASGFDPGGPPVA
jgi:hypothetical protein